MRRRLLVVVIMRRPGGARGKVLAAHRGRMIPRVVKSSLLRSAAAIRIGRCGREGLLMGRIAAVLLILRRGGRASVRGGVTAAVLATVHDGGA